MLAAHLGVDFHGSRAGMLRHGRLSLASNPINTTSPCHRRARLLPAVRQAPPDWLIITDGFSCRETDRPMHAAARASPGRGLANGNAGHTRAGIRTLSRIGKRQPEPSESTSFYETYRIGSGSLGGDRGTAVEDVQKSLILSRLAVFVAGFFRLSLAKLPHIWDNRTLAARPAVLGIVALWIVKPQSPPRPSGKFPPRPCRL